MNINQSKEKLSSFLGGRVLTFNIVNFSNEEWTAECNEIPSIITGGMGEDITERDVLLRDAILTAAGVDNQFSGELLKFVGYSEKNNSFTSFFRKRGDVSLARYVPA